MKRNIISIVIALIILSSCDKANENTDKVVSLKNLPVPGLYLDQPPYVDGVDDLQGNDLELLDTITDSVLSSDASWQFYDSKYSGTLPQGLKQTIGFTILSDKDLIGRVRLGGTNEEKEALKKYIGVLSDNTYSGYCLLYHALKEVNDPGFRKEKAAKIYKYAQVDTFYDAAMQNTEAPNNTLNLVQANYAYVDSLRIMAN